MTEPIRFKGAPGSPYTRKMMAVLRYRRIPYAFLGRDDLVPADYPVPKVALLPTFYLPNETGKIEAVVDSTPLIRRFEREHEGRSVIPNDQAMTFINYLLEDFGDEWLTKMMFHYRWYYDADIKQAGEILPLWRNYGMSDAALEKTAQYIRDRQISRLYVVGSNDITAPVIEASYLRTLEILNGLFQRHPFLLGARPGSADFAFYAQLTQLAGFDPTPRQLCLDRAPRVFAYTDVMDDLSGLEPEDSDWLGVAGASTHLKELLSEVGRVYVPALFANASAISHGQKSFETEIDGKVWQQPSFPYQAKCLQWIREQYHEMSGEAQGQVSDLLMETGCEALISQ